VGERMGAWKNIKGYFFGESNCMILRVQFVSIRVFVVLQWLS
jgi:hypothetical protein